MSRSPAAHQRALDAGMVNVPLEILLSKSNWILNIVPPGDVFTFVRRVLAVSYSAPLPLPRAFVDCNTVNPKMVKCIGGLFKEAPVGFIDVGIAGTPLRTGWDPTFDACAGAGIGDASSLKLCEFTMRKGSIGLFMMMMLTTHRSSPATADALMKELSVSQPALMGRLIQTVSEGIPKAYRFVAEMEGLAEFVGGGEADVFKDLRGCLRGSRDRLRMMGRMSRH
ncbi:hypothetical protein DFJ58DRAFT_855799 [Suillus subalutaceus]|uniref:uncharacterized protein n=1 Tax=Suillus subalutaceus TaxID=48586 RepID=UPI001B8789EF|nr:uncharacterized protein DFJ58DRAFT_855799 [Suillus subalutaceus]KAG1869435.1 hypothetical protein DFJ58DRAFT_855799 [Suillus subalutaceus]